MNDQRYWAMDLDEDHDGYPFPFGTETIGIVDEEMGGIFLYLHRSEESRILDILRNADSAS